jgi:hypothetical protein
VMKAINKYEMAKHCRWKARWTSTTTALLDELVTSHDQTLALPDMWHVAPE